MNQTLTDPVDSSGGGPPRMRFSRRSILVAVASLAVLVAGLAVNRTLGGQGSPQPAPDPIVEVAEEDARPVIDVADFPRGALAGEMAPEIRIALFDGSEFLLSRHLSADGRPVVLNLWASWCTPCRREIPEFSRVAEMNPDVAFVGAAVEDARGPAEAFASEIGASFPLGIDEYRTVKNGYPFVGLPVTYLIGADGTVARQIQGQLDAVNLQAFIDHDFGS